MTVGGSPLSPLYSAAITATVPSGYANMTCTLGGTKDLTPFVGVAFMVQGIGTGVGKSYWFQAVSTSVTTGDHWGNTFTAPASWTPVTIFFNQVHQRGFGSPAQPFNQSQVTDRKSVV